MNFNIYYSQLNSIAADGLIKTLHNRDKSQKHIIITPDKSSLYFERKMFFLKKKYFLPMAFFFINLMI